MKRLFQILLVLFVVLPLLSGLSSCSRNTTAPGRTAGINPAAPKYTTVRKKYIINNKRRHILGLDSRK